jgi:signal transduction histidine kinase
MPSAAAAIAALRQRTALAERLEAEADPRRGLESLCQHLAERLRDETGATCSALVLPGSEGAPALMAEPAGPAFRVAPTVQRELEATLARLPTGPLTWQSRGSGSDLLVLHDPAAHARAHAADDTLPQLQRLAALLEVERLLLVPLRYLGRDRGHLLLGLPASADGWDAAELAHLAPALQRLIQQASLVDELQSEIAAHERARIGRDLHDSAIQPYLGLKYAVEAVAAECTPDNPLHERLQSLAELVQHEIGELRELISVLRTGEVGRDNALLPAVRRQARRFQRLFGIQVHLEVPAELPTSRALADAVFHMTNEAMNNVRKHTTARQVRVRLQRRGDLLELAVRDDGRTAEPFVPASLSQRTRELGGTLAVAIEAGVYTEIRIAVPLSAA